VTAASKSLLIGVLLLVAVTATRDATGEDWPRFRGANGTGVSTSRGLPTEFGPEKNVAWKIEAGKGSSSPIISHGRLFFTSFDGDERTLHCLDAATGKLQWGRSVKKIRVEIASRPNGPATPTPASDGENVFVLYPDVGVLCYSALGQEKWRITLEPFHSMHGVASSLVTVDNLVIVVVDQLDGSYIAAFKSDSGALAWKTERVNGITGGFSTPAVYRPSSGPAQLVVSGPFEVVGYEVATGKRVWWINGITNAPISVPVIWHNRAFVCEPVGEPVPFAMLAPYDKDKDGKISMAEIKSDVTMSRLLERIDKGFGNHTGFVGAAEWDKAFGKFVNKGGLVAIELGGTGDATQTNIRWSYRKAVPYIPSALVYDDLVYVVKDGGILSAFEAASGKLVKQARLKSGGRRYDASPIAADGLIYLLNADGGMNVVKAGRDWKLLTMNELGEPCSATPAISDGRLYVRTAKSLFCFRKSS
jgi:outer membrane protein assembly factor BamB